MPAAKVNKAMRIDTLLVEPAGRAAAGLVRRLAAVPTRSSANLAFRNLTRAQMVKLATGQQMCVLHSRA